ncbi:MAG: alpha/beta hydrolase [Burkholderiaceae bacterium]|nr:alpha/beta hydrolase [Burkholderiaceae bacterium]
MQFPGLFSAATACGRAWRRGPLVLLALGLAFSAAAQGPVRERLAERRAQAGAGSGSEIETEGAGPSVRAPLPPGVRLVADRAYGADALQKLDAYIPAQAQGAPVIFMVHGGAWRTGSKTARGVVGNKVDRWVSRGFIVVSTNYRLLPGADPLVQADDVARALAFAQKAAAGWGGDAGRFVLMGHSAGAHLVALLNANPQRALAQGARPWLGTVALDSALLDVAPVMERRHLPFYDAAFGSDPAFWRAASPQQQLVRGATPLLAVCSTQRRDRPCDGAQRFADHAGTLGVRAEVLGQPMTHGEINAQLGLPGAYTDAVEAFLASLDPLLRARLGR